MFHLSGLDHMFLSLDTATTSAIMGGLTTFAAPAEGQPVPDEAFLRDRLAERVRYIPPMSMRIFRVPFAMDHDYLVPIENFDAGERVRTVTLPAPGGSRELAEQVSQIMSTGFAEDDWLWDLTVIEGVDGGGLAHLLRVHHGVIDGSTMPTVWDLLADEPTTPLPEITEEPSVTEADVMAQVMSNTVMRPMRMMEFQRKFIDWLRSRIPEEGPDTLGALAARMMPGEMGGKVRAMINDRRRAAGEPEVEPYLPTMSAPRVSFQGKISAQRHFAYATMDFARVRAVGKKMGTTLNNVVVTICAGAMRRYLAEHGGPLDEPLIVCCPVSLREPEIDNPWLNHVHMMFAELPTNVADPLDRLRIVTGNLQSAKANFDAMPFSLLREASQFVPRDMFDMLVNGMVELPDDMQRMPWNVVVSNVRGSRDAVHMNGLEVTAYFPASFLPPAGGISITLQSHVDRIGFGLIGDPEKSGDLWPLADQMIEVLEELEQAVEQQGSAAQLQDGVTSAQDPATGDGSTGTVTGEPPAVVPADTTTLPAAAGDDSASHR